MNNIPHIIDTGASVMNNEPVAWMEYIQGEEWEVWFVEPTDLPKGHTYKPLYTHPEKTLTDAEFDKIFANGKRLGVLETEDRFRKAMNLTDEELESWITEWAKNLYGTLYVEPTDHQRTMAIKMARAILRKAQEK
jgi:hypothetical protein